MGPMIDVDKYLERIGFAGVVQHDVATLEVLQRAHLTTVPFENLHIFHKLGVRTDVEWSYNKIVEQGRGGWCFENNGAFAELLIALGFDVARLGAAVLLGGPNATIDHLCLEVTLDEPYLVDVGFGDSFIRPLRLNGRDPQDGGLRPTFQFMMSSQGLTLTEDVKGVPEAQYRFHRVNREQGEFDAASEYLQGNPELHWSQKPFATRLLDGGPDRVTLLSDRIKFFRNGSWQETPVAAEHWDETLAEWFAMSALPA